MTCKSCEERRKLLKDTFEKTKETIKRGVGKVKESKKKDEGVGD